jgi:hypothetical protein
MPEINPITERLKQPLRWVGVVLWVLFYLFVMREVRVTLTDTYASELHARAVSEYIDITHSTKSTAIQVVKQEQQYRVQIFFGQYLLLGLIGLLLVTVRWRLALFLVLLHLIASLINGMVLWLLATGSADFIFVSQALQRFIIPVLSLGVIPFGYWLDAQPRRILDPNVT